MAFTWSKKNILIGASVVLTLGAIAVGLFWSSRPTCDDVLPYASERDRSAIIKLFTNNWYWLIPEETPFSVEYFLDHKTPDQNGTEDNISSIFVYCKDNKTVGMISFYPMSFYRARLHFIIVDKDYRGRGISDKLMRFALDQMKDRQFTKVELITRVDNIPAQNLYNRFGFKEFYRDNRFVRYEKELT